MCVRACVCVCVCGCENRKIVGLDDISPEFWKTRKFDHILLRLCNAV